MESRPLDCRTKVRISYAIVGILIGVSVFCVFGFKYENWNAAVWGMTSGMVAAATLYIHVRHWRSSWNVNPAPLRFWMLLGCFKQLSGVCGFAVYLALAIQQKQGLVIYGAGYYLTLVWCFMTWKWGFILFLSARRYRKQYLEVYTIIPEDDNDTYYS